MLLRQHSRPLAKFAKHRRPCNYRVAITRDCTPKRQYARTVSDAYPGAARALLMIERHSRPLASLPFVGRCCVTYASLLGMTGGGGEEGR